jgi:hypothetical protein
MNARHALSRSDSKISMACSERMSHALKHAVTNLECRRLCCCELILVQKSAHQLAARLADLYMHAKPAAAQGRSERHAHA